MSVAIWVILSSTIFAILVVILGLLEIFKPVETVEEDARSLGTASPDVELHGLLVIRELEGREVAELPAEPHVMRGARQSQDCFRPFSFELPYLSPAGNLCYLRYL
jgi:hypothetical protein